MRTVEPEVSALVVRDESGLDELRQGWDRLALHAVQPTQRFEWTRAAVGAFGGDIAVTVLGPPDDPVAIAPLVRRNGRAEIIGAAELGEPADFLYAGDDGLEVLAHWLARTNETLWLPRVPATSRTPQMLVTAYRSAGLAVVRSAGAHPVIHLDAGWCGPEGKLSSRRRQDVRRARRRAEALGEVTFELHEVADDAVIDEAFAVEGRGWKGRAGTALEANRRQHDFFRAYAHAVTAHGALRLRVMRIGGRAAAMELAVEHDDRLWLLKIGYDEEFARCSPGVLTLLESIRWASARELVAVQMLGTAEGWTRVFTESVEACVAVAAYSVTGRGIAAVASDAARVARNRVVAALR